LSREEVEGLTEVVHSVDPFGPDLQELQKSDEQLIKINVFQKEGKWPLNTTKAEQRLLVHGTILSGHDALKKTYLRLTNAYFWPNMKKRHSSQH